VASSWEAVDRFQRFNRERLNRLEAQVGERAAQAVHALSFLLHTNQEGLPGYMGDAACPFGVTSYEPRLEDFELMRRLFPDIEVRRVPVPRMAVDLVAVMGSAGSIGFAEGSDLDIWICFRLGEHGPFGLSVYRQKVLEIEKWMNRHAGVEIHLFVQPVEQIRTNNFGEADLEGCGSAMGMLLKEEFYRTAIVLSGRMPLWWIVPPEATPADYQSHFAALSEAPGFDSQAFVDLGAVDSVSIGELFGAAIWQIAKGQKSPFKSALKMAYLEKVVCSGEKQIPLCEIYKREVIAGNRPDPYRLLFDVVLQYYREQSDLASQELLAECFYLKTGLRLNPSALGTQQNSEDAEVLRRYVLSWRWGGRKVERLNDFSGWKFEWIKTLSSDLNGFFLRSYKRLHDAMERAGGRQAITDRDLTIIGRKLLVAYRQMPNKMDRIHIMGGGVSESILSLIETPLVTGDSEWRLYRGLVNPLNEEERIADLIRSFPDVNELMAWAAYNGVLSNKTRLLCRPLAQQFSSAELEALAPFLVEFLNNGEDRDPSSEDLLNDPRPFQMVVVANLGHDEDEIVEIGALYQTNWGETFYRNFRGRAALREFSEELLFPFWSNALDPSKVTVFAPRRRINALTSPGARLKKWLPRLNALFVGEPLKGLEHRRHILTTSEGPAVIERTPSGFGFNSYASKTQLLRHLSGVGPYDRIKTLVDNEVGNLELLSAVFEASEYGKINIFVGENERPPTLYVVDEIGNFFMQECEAGDPVYALAKLLVFLENAIRILRSQTANPLSAAKPNEAVKILKFASAPPFRAYAATNDFLARVADLGLNPVGLSIEKTHADLGKAMGYVITWGTEVIRSGEVAHPLEELKRRISAQRRAGTEYGVYVTELFLDDQFVKNNCGGFSTVGHYLVYKRALEQRLNS
jgi:adenylate cyclase class 1